MSAEPRNFETQIKQDLTKMVSNIVHSRQSKELIEKLKGYVNAICQDNSQVDNFGERRIALANVLVKEAGLQTSVLGFLGRDGKESFCEMLTSQSNTEIMTADNRTTLHNVFAREEYTELKKAVIPMPIIPGYEEQRRIAKFLLYNIEAKENAKAISQYLMIQIGEEGDDNSKIQIAGALASLPEKKRDAVMATLTEKEQKIWHNMLTNTENKKLSEQFSDKKYNVLRESFKRVDKENANGSKRKNKDF